MNLKTKYYCIALLIAAQFIFSCKKDPSCEDCIENNKPPIAIAGPDQVITLPTDSISLDGVASSDPDGTISIWLWTRISGPAFFLINNSSSSTPVIKNLVQGVYQFELKVTDNGGLAAKDTVQIIVNDPSQPNRPPIAGAGPDQIVTLPTNTVTLNGSASADPDNNITGYVWTKISGPSSFNIANANAIETHVASLTEGIYQFELKVTDAGGLFSKDTVQVFVYPAGTMLSCTDTGRPRINTQYVPFATMSQARSGTSVAAAGNKMLFAGGYINGNLTPSSRVDIYDFTTQLWSTAELNVPRFGVSALVAGNKIFFSGGYYYDPLDQSYDNPIPVNVMDVYDASSNTWSVITSANVIHEASVAEGNKLFFVNDNKVNIYDIDTDNWSTSLLSDDRTDPSAVSANNKVYFAGGVRHQGNNIYGPIMMPVNTIDIYDITANAWSVSTLVDNKLNSAGIAASGKVYFAGGYTSNINTPPPATSCAVDVIDVSTGNRSVQYFSREWPHPVNAATKNNKIIFIPIGAQSLSNAEFDIYDLATNDWSIGIAPQPIPHGSVFITVNNTIYFAGGTINGNINNQVWKLEF